jgi:aerobic-type carbon monoxide dehydrogenase small subunit (CoxS/CutS family)
MPDRWQIRSRPGSKSLGKRGVRRHRHSAIQSRQQRRQQRRQVSAQQRRDLQAEAGERLAVQAAAWASARGPAGRPQWSFAGIDARRSSRCIRRGDVATVLAPMTEPKKQLATFRVNGEDHEVAFVPHKTLLEVLREEMALTGTKHGCELGECGTCTVQVDGVPILSCLCLAVDAVGKEVRTVEGLATGSDLTPLQHCLADLGAAQCGYCTPGVLMAADALLQCNRQPSRDQIKEALAGNLCRCTGYLKIFEAVELAAARMRGEQAEPSKESIYGS